MYSKNMRRSLGILLIFAILFTVFPIGVFADEPELPETETTVTRISAVAIAETPAKDEYQAGETLDLSGLKISVTQEVYDNVTGATEPGDSYEVVYGDAGFDEEFTTAPEVGTLLKVTDTEVVITHTESGKQDTYPITVAPAAEVPAHGLQDGYYQADVTPWHVNGEQYYAKYIAWAAQKGIANGVGDGNFAPDQEITREQLAVILANYVKFAGIDLASVQPAETTAGFADEELISSWAKESVALMRQSGLLLGKENSQFDPKGTATRAEIATIIARVLEMFTPEDTETDMQE